MKIKLKIEVEVDDDWFNNEEEKDLFINASNDSKRLWLFERFEQYVREENLTIEEF